MSKQARMLLQLAALGATAYLAYRWWKNRAFDQKYAGSGLDQIRPLIAADVSNLLNVRLPEL